MKPQLSENGFALYIAMGLIALMTVLVGSVGVRLTAINDQNARAARTTQILTAAQDAHYRALRMLKTLAAPKNLPTSSSQAGAGAARTACLATRVSNPASYIASDAFTAADISARYFIARSSAGSDIYRFTIYGCAIGGTKQHVAQSSWEHDGLLDTFTLINLSRY